MKDTPRSEKVCTIQRRIAELARVTREGIAVGTFDFLGFTHYWGTSRQGRRVVPRKTMSGRLS